MIDLEQRVDEVDAARALVAIAVRQSARISGEAVKRRRARPMIDLMD